MLTNSGCPWSEAFVRDLADKEERDIFVADQVRARIAQLVRSLREHEDRGWTQKELGERASKRQNVISRLENPDESPPSVQTLLEIAAAFDLPLWIDFPQWEEWLARIGDVPSKHDSRRPFDVDRLSAQAELSWPRPITANIVHLASATAMWRATATSSHGIQSAVPINANAMDAGNDPIDFEDVGGIAPETHLYAVQFA